MPKVFISHSWDNNDVSRKIAHDLKRDGAEIWIDYARISGGESLPERISQALEWCDTLVLIWSKSAATSKWVAKEWTSALSLDKTIVPCLLDDAKLPAILCSLLYINFKNAEAGYNELCHALKLQTLEEKKQAEAEKLKLEQERLEAERKENEKQRRLKAEQERQEKEQQLKLQAEQERQKRERERLRLQEAERKEKERQRILQAEQEKQKKEYERLQSLKAKKLRKERLRKLKDKLVTKKTVYAILSIITIFIGIYIVVTFISSKQLKNQIVENVPTLRSDSTSLSADEVKGMLEDKNFFDSYLNKTGRGFSNRFGIDIIKGEKVVIDSASGLMWQQSGSSNYMYQKEAKEYIQELNRDKFAGFNNWRLPTLEEAMSLMETKQMNVDLYIDPKFDAEQRWIWTADQVSGESLAWVVFFYYGYCSLSGLDGNYYVRAVRSGQLSTE